MLITLPPPFPDSLSGFSDQVPPTKGSSLTCCSFYLLNACFIETKIVEVDLFVWEVFSDVVNTDYRFTKVVIA